MLLIILILILVIYLLCELGSNLYREEFDNSFNANNIDYYVISLKSADRLQNINDQLKKYNIDYNLIDGVHWKTIDQDKLLKQFILGENFYDKKNSKRNKEIGCYQSHLKIYNKIVNSDKPYSIILEDDFNVISFDLVNDINKILEKMKDVDFDIIFLGNTYPNAGENYKDNIYKVDKNKETVGCFGYLINNKNIKKILNCTRFIDEPIDLKFNSLIKTDNLNIYTISPYIINYRMELPSVIIS
jgi:glycosyl transferase, family 25